MKTQVFKSGIVLLAALLLSGFTAGTLAQEAEKSISEDYSISKGFTLGIDNQYGEINIVNWDKDELAVVVTVIAESSNQERAEKLLDDVEIAIEESSSSVYFETEIEKRNMNGKNKVKIIYEVKTPKYINAELEQSYGDVFIQDLTGKANIELRYSDLTANVLSSTDQEEWNTLEVKYGNATIEEAGGLDAEVRYSGFNVGEAAVLNLESAYSKLSLGEVGEVNMESKYDKVKVEFLTGALDMESAYTQLSIGTVAKTFKGISAEMTYGNLKGGLEEGTSFNVDAEVSYGSIKLPEGDYDKVKDGTRQYAEGNVGGKSDAMVDVSIKYGNLVLE